MKKIAKPTKNQIATGVGLGVLLYLALDAVRMAYWARKAHDLSELMYTGQATLGKGRKLRLFVDGDSLAAGVGASKRENSLISRLSALLAKEYTVELTNNSRSRAEFKDLIHKPLPTQKQDMTILIVSSNDVLYFSKLAQIKKDAEIVLKRYSKMTKTLFLVGPGDIGSSKLIPPALRLVYKRRIKLVNKTLYEISSHISNVIYIETEAILKQLPKDYYIDYLSPKDRFHLSDKGQKKLAEILYSFIIESKDRP